MNKYEDIKMDKDGMWTAIYCLKIPAAIYWKHMKLQIS